jgi:hypothetical protein
MGEFMKQKPGDGRNLGTDGTFPGFSVPIWEFSIPAFQKSLCVRSSAMFF